MMEQDIINIRWHVDRSADPVLYQLICTDDTPEYADLIVSLPSDQVSERVARARLIEKMFELCRSRNIDVTKLRFTVNGIDG